MISQAIKQSHSEVTDDVVEEYEGAQRAVHLEKDWLEVVVDGKPVRVNGLEDAMDDEIGPMVNKKVKVTVIRNPKGIFRLRDIERVS